MSFQPVGASSSTHYFPKPSFDFEGMSIKAKELKNMQRNTRIVMHQICPEKVMKPYMRNFMQQEVCLFSITL